MNVDILIRVREACCLLSRIGLRGKLWKAAGKSFSGNDFGELSGRVANGTHQHRNVSHITIIHHPIRWIPVGSPFCSWLAFESPGFFETSCWVHPNSGPKTQNWAPAGAPGQSPTLGAGTAFALKPRPIPRVEILALVNGRPIHLWSYQVCNPSWETSSGM